MEGADRVAGQLRGDKECPFSGVTNLAEFGGRCRKATLGVCTEGCMYCRYFPCSFLSGLECKAESWLLKRRRWGESGIFSAGDTGGERERCSMMETRVGRKRELFSAGNTGGEVSVEDEERTAG